MTDNAVTESPASHTDSVGSLWLRAAWWCLVAGLCWAALAYPLNVRIASFWKGWQWFADLPGMGSVAQMLRAFFMFETSPVTLKTAGASFFLFAAFACWLTWSILYRRYPRSVPLEVAVVLALLVWATVSLLWAPHYGLDSAASKYAWSLATWVGAAIALFGMPREAHAVRRLVHWLIGVGILVAAISALQATPPFDGWIFRIFNRYEGAYGRNLYGSVIGHNTGVAVFCLGPFFLAVAMFTQARRWTTRLAWTASLLLFLYVFVITKSRFVWVAVPVLVLGFTIVARSVLGFRIRWRWVAAAVLVGAVLLGWQVARRGPQERSDYLTRLLSYRPSVLVEGTRARIIAVSLPLVAERPVIGHGLGSFSPIFAGAQAEYFARHPFSRLRPTDALTRYAHNDYLQLLIETGGVGLSMGLFLLAVLLAKGWRRMHASPDPFDRAVRTGALFGVLGICMHALLDFPFHIPSIVTFFVALVWLFCASGYHPRPVLSAPIWENTTRLRWRKVAVLTLLLALWSVVAVNGWFAWQRMVVDYHFKRGMELVRQGTLGEGRDHLRTSLALDPRQFEPRLHLMRCETGLAREVMRRYEEPVEEVPPVRAAGNRTTALYFVDSAIETAIEASHMARGASMPAPIRDLPRLGTRLNHQLAHLYALNLQMHARLADDTESVRRARTAWALAVRYGPAVRQYLEQSLRILDVLRPADRGERLHVQKLLARYHPEAFRDQIMRAVWLADDGQQQRAVALLEEMLTALPDIEAYPDIQIALAAQYFQSGDRAAFEAMLKRLQQNHGDLTEVQGLEIVSWIADGRIGRATERLLTLEAQGHPLMDQNIYAVLLAELLRRQGRTDEFRKRLAALLHEAPAPQGLMASLAYYQRTLFDDRDAAIDTWTRAAAYLPAFASTLGWRTLLEDAWERGDTDALGRFLFVLGPADEHESAAMRETVEAYQKRLDGRELQNED